MNYLKYIQLLFLAIFLLPVSSDAQECVDYHMLGDCMLDRQKSFKVYSQSKSVSMSLLDTLEYNVVFYGQKEYIISFCAHRKMYPIHFVLLDQDTQRVLYDNENDKYIESLGVGFDATRSLTMRINLLSRLATEEEIQDYIGCLGMLLQYKNYKQKKVNLRMQ